MHQARILADFQVRRKRAEKIHVVRGQHTLMIFQCAPRIAIKCFKRNLADDCHVMIPEDTSEIGNLAHLLEHRVRIGSVSHHIPQAPGLVDRSRVFEYCFQSCVVGMNVGDHKNTHNYSSSAASRSMMVSATSLLLISGKDSLRPSANKSVTRFVSTAKPASSAEMSFAAMKSSPLDFNLAEAFSNTSRDSAANPTIARGCFRFWASLWLDTVFRISSVASSSICGMPPSFLILSFA